MILQKCAHFTKNVHIFEQYFQKLLQNTIVLRKHHFHFHIRMQGTAHSYLDARQPTRIYTQLKAL